MNGMLSAMGTLEVKGSTFRYAPPGGKLGAFSPYAMGGDGKITWNGPMGAINEAPSVIKDSFVETKPNYRSIIVKFQPVPGAYWMSMGCRNDVKPGHR
jgi:hypothetical protein